MSKLRLHMAANGHIALDFDEYDSKEWFIAVSILEDEQGFIRQGKAVMGMDEGIMPSFVKGNVSIAAGWDNWSGNYLLSESKEADEVINAVYTKLTAQG